MASPTYALFERGPTLLAADTVTLAGASPTNPRVALLSTTFGPSPALVFADLALLEAVFDGYTAGGIDSVAGPQVEAQIPGTHDEIVELAAPAGGFKWITGVSFAGSTTIFGYAVWNFDDGILFWSALLDTPVTLNGVGQIIEIPAPRLRFTLIGVV